VAAEREGGGRDRGRARDERLGRTQSGGAVLNWTVPAAVGPVPVTFAVKVTEPPKLELAGPETAVELGSLTSRVPVPFWVPVQPVPTPRTLNVVDPAGVAAVVEIVSVEVWFAPFGEATELGLNVALAPVGNAVVTLSATLQVDVLLPPNPTVMV